MVDVIWSVDSLDSAGADKHGIARAGGRATCAPGAIVLMHENRGQTIQALHKILPALAPQAPAAGARCPSCSGATRRAAQQLDRGRDGCPRQTGRVSLGG